MREARTILVLLLARYRENCSWHLILTQVINFLIETSTFLPENSNRYYTEKHEEQAYVR